MVPPDFQTELRMRLEEAGIPFDITINDLEIAIKEENPNVTDSGDDFDNRFSNRNCNNHI